MTTGYFGTKAHMAWGNMIQRCCNPKNPSFPRYGGKGITVCNAWRDFRQFHADMGDPPSDRHSLERIDNAGNYEPANCKWATMKEQCRNFSRNLLLTLNGTTKPAVVWAEELGVNPKTLYTRKERGWTDERTLTQPVKAVNASS